MFLRCVLSGHAGPWSRGIVGFVSTACTAKGIPEIKIDAELEEIIKWFNHYLPHSKVIFNDSITWWFKDTATKQIEKTEKLASCLLERGFKSTWYRANELKPVYEDRFQAAAYLGRRGWKKT